MSIEWNSLPPTLLSRVMIKGLYGLHDYDINLNVTGDERNSRLALLYGDNGCGKTTIVNLIHHSLSRKSSKGHRTFIASIRFSEFLVELNNGGSMHLKRKKGECYGDYTAEFSNAKGEKLSVAVKAKKRDHNYTVGNGDVDDSRLNQGFKLISSEHLDTYLLSDSREFQSDILPEDSDAHFIKALTHDGTFTIMPRWKNSENSSQISLAIKRAESWMRRAALSARNENDTSVAKIYSNLIENITKHHQAVKGSSELSRSSLKARLSAISEKHSKLSELGLSSEISDLSLLDTLITTNDETFDLVAPILAPYLESLDAKAKALSLMAYRLETLRDTINQFFTYKTIKIHAIDGISLSSMTGDNLSPDKLSSGEKHLLLLMLNVLIGTEGQSLFLIDEPELSLNVKWQRKIVNSLLDLSQGANVQFILATHSIELLSKHKSAIKKLVMSPAHG